MRTLTRTLRDGLRAVLSPRPGTGTVATKVLVDAGDRYAGEQHGLAHCVEHLLFKGTANRTSREIYAAIEAVGGKIDAQTAKEYVAISVVTGASHLPHALDVLSDLFLHPRFEPGTLESEKSVIRQELSRRADNLSTLWDLYDLTVWQVHPYRHRALGYESTLEDLTLEDVVRHYARFFLPQATVVAISGECDVERSVALLGDLWSEGPSGEPVYPLISSEPPLVEGRRNYVPRRIGQTHLVLGWPTVGMRHPDSYVLKIIERIMGAGANSRLFREVRDRRGLAYSVRAVRSELVDLGHFSVYTATDPGQARAAIDAILEQIARLQRDSVSSDELEVAKTSYEGSLAVSFETNLKMAGITGIETLLMGAFEPFDEATRRVGAVTADDVLRVAQTYFNPDCYALASLGPQDPMDA